MCTTPTGAMGLAGMGAQAVGALAKGRQEQQQYDYQSGVADIDASTARQIAAIEAAKTRKAGRSARSTAVSEFAAGGADLTQGAAAKVAQRITRDAEEDAQMALLTGKYKSQRLESQADVYDVAGDNAMRAGIADTATSLLSTGAYAKKKGWIT
jgi:hypothetical protein